MGSPLRILHVVVNMNRGGAETLIMNIYRNIDRDKIQFDFLTCNEGVFDEEIMGLGGKIYRIPYVSEVGHFEYKRKLREFFNKHKYKILHAHLDKMSGLVLREAKKAGVPIRISHSHNTRSEGNIPIRTYKWYVGKLIHSNATDLIACSEYAANWLFNKDSRNSVIWKNGIECEKFEFSLDARIKIRQELGINSKTMVLGHVGRFNYQKNHSFLIDVFYEYQKKNENSILLLIGQGPLKTDIERKVRLLNIDEKVKFLGMRNDIPILLQGIDGLVFPSHHEGFPLSLVEAQSAGLHCFISEQISKEVDLGLNLMTFLSLSDPVEWVNTIKEKFREPSIMNRSCVITEISKQGYNIKETATQIEDYYLSTSR